MANLPLDVAQKGSRMAANGVTTLTGGKSGTALAITLTLFVGYLFLSGKLEAVAMALKSGSYTGPNPPQPVSNSGGGMGGDGSNPGTIPSAPLPPSSGSGVPVLPGVPIPPVVQFTIPPADSQHSAVQVKILRNSPGCRPYIYQAFIMAGYPANRANMEALAICGGSQ